MVTLIGSEVGMALPTTALFDYPSAEALAYFIASAQVGLLGKTLNSQQTSVVGQQSLLNHPSAEALPTLQISGQAPHHATAQGQCWRTPPIAVSSSGAPFALLI